MQVVDSSVVAKTANLTLNLSILATSGLVVCWTAFWIVVARTKTNVLEVLLSPGFFRTVVVMGVIAAAVVLGLVGQLPGNITGAILSGIVGYVLGHLSGRGRQRADKE